LAEDLDRFLTGRAILARPTGAVEHIRKWIQRRPAVALLSAAVMTLTVLGFTLVSWQWQRAEAKAEAAADANKLALQASLVAYEKQAELTFHQALAMCDQGEVGRGLVWLGQSLELARAAKSEGLDLPIRINLADWAGQLSRPRHLPLMRHSGPVLDIAFGGNGRELVSVGKDGVARIWNTTTGHELEQPLALGSHPSEARLEYARFSPSGSNLLEVVDYKGKASVWDVNNRRELTLPSTRPPEHRNGDADFPYNQHIITYNNDNIYSSCGSNRRPTGVGESPKQNRRRHAKWALSRDGRTLATADQDRLVRRWDVAAKRLLEPELHLDTSVEAIALSPDGRKVVTGRRAGRLHVWDADTERGFDLPPQGTGVTCLAFSPDGRVFASGTEGGVIRLWDTSLLGTIGQTCKFAGAATALAFAPEGRVLAIGCDDGTIRLWEIPNQRALGVPLQVKLPVQSVSFRDDGRRVLIGTTEGTRVLDLTGLLVRESDQGRDERSSDGELSRIEATAVSPDGATVATSRSVSLEGRTCGWAELRDAVTGKLLRQTLDQPQALSGVAFSADSKWLLTWGPEPKTARLWKLATLRDARSLCQSLNSPINQAAFSRDGRVLLLGCRDGKARIWNVDADVEIDFEHVPRHAYPITSVAFDPSGSRLVTGCHAGTVRVWDATRGTLLRELRQNAGEIVVLAFSPGGKMFLTTSCDGTARFVDAASGAQLGPALHHTDAVLCAAFHPDGQSVVTGTRDGMVQRWSVPSSPRTGGNADIRQWLEEQTGMKLDDQGAVTMSSLCD
jgi:WD40 repeat protein